MATTVALQTSSGVVPTAELVGVHTRAQRALRARAKRLGPRSEAGDIARLRREVEARAAELARSNAELRQFTYAVSHDLSEPLRSISGFAQLLAQDYGGRLDETADEYIAFIVDSTRRMKTLINDLLAYSRMGSQPTERRRVHSGSVVNQSLDSLAAQILETYAIIDVPKRLPSVYVDRTQFRQLIQNLLNNALKFRPENAAPQIAVRAVLESGRWWHFAVSDNGIGIEPRHRHRIFEMFKQLNDRERYPGSGIGLATCKLIVENHGGRIWVEDSHLGGASFHFTVPVRAQAAG